MFQKSIIMAKINHNNLYLTINELMENAKQQKVIHLYAQGKYLKGNSILINDKRMAHFATTGYLGLEQDPRLKQAAVEAIWNYGTQFPLSKTYVSHPLYEELESKLMEMYNTPVIVTKNSTLAHLSVIPQAVLDDDLVILDHQVHWSVHNACDLLKIRGIPIKVIRHNNMQQLEDYLNRYRNKHKKIWYMADGIYSMYGDKAPIVEIKYLMHKYDQLHVYFDDVHGMSWLGNMGTGFVKSHWEVLNDRIIVISTLSKTFGASGAIIICGNKELANQIKNYGGPLTFSAQLEPCAVAAAIASAKIHTSPEIYTLQNKLQRKIKTFNEALIETKLPLISNGETPVFYLATSLPSTAYEMVNFLQMEGFFVNPGIYPAVPMKNAGLRITISNHNKTKEIQKLKDALIYYYPIALEKTNNSLFKINKAFNRKNTEKELDVNYSDIKIEILDSISEIQKNEWNEFLAHDGILDYEGMKFIENTFSNLPDDDPNKIVLRYIKISDHKDELLLLTSVSIAIWKDDLIAPVRISDKLEKLRKENPLIFTSKTLSLGSLFTDGIHLYFRENNDNSRKIFKLFLETLEKIREQYHCEKIVLRDFKENQYFPINLINEGYVKMEMPDAACLLNLSDSSKNFLSTFSKRNRRHFRTDILPYLETHSFEILNFLDEIELKQAYEMYLNVHDNNRAINTFKFPFELFVAMNLDDNWSFIKLKDENETFSGVMFCFHNQISQVFNPLYIGLIKNKDNRLTHYRLLLYYTILAAREKKCKEINYGMSAIFEKKKLGATATKRFAFVHTTDNYSTDVLNKI